MQGIRRQKLRFPCRPRHLSSWLDGSSGNLAKLLLPGKPASIQFSMRKVFGRPSVRTVAQTIISGPAGKLTSLYANSFQVAWSHSMQPPADRECSQWTDCRQSDVMEAGMGISLAALERSQAMKLLPAGASVLDIGSSNLYSATPEGLRHFLSQYDPVEAGDHEFI